MPRSVAAAYFVCALTCNEVFHTDSQCTRYAHRHIRRRNRRTGAQIKAIRKAWHNDIYAVTCSKGDSIIDALNPIMARLNPVMAELVKIDKMLWYLLEPRIEINEANALSFLFDKYNSDKGSMFRDDVHSYSPVYTKLFSAIRHDVKAVFERGVFKGASLRAWRDYFDSAKIIGADINVNAMFDEDNIHTGLMDQTKAESIKNFFSSLPPQYPCEFDIMIDDGCHIYDATTTLFNEAFKHLRNGGIYVIEDMTSDCFAKYKEFFKPYTDGKKVSVEYCALHGIRSNPSRGHVRDDTMIIIRKGE